MNVSGEPILSPWLAARALLRSTGGAPGTGPHGNVRLYGHARHALLAGLNTLAPGSLLTPALICDTAVESLPPLGHPIRFYPVRDDLRPDWDWLERNRAPVDSAFLLVHYFGFANDLELAVEYCRRNGLALVEDCAHSFLSEHDGQPLGSSGEFAILSYRKILPLRSGGGFYSKAGRTVPSPTPSHGGTVRFLLRELAKWAVFRCRSSTLRRLLASSVSDEREGPPVCSAAIDWFSRRVMERLASRLPAIRTRRRQNYAALLLGLAAVSGLELLRPNLGPGDCPWAFPLLLEDRDELLEVLLHEGIGAWVWPELPRDDYFMEGTPPPTHLARRILLLPVHQDLGRSEMRYITDTITAWAASR